MVDLDVTPNSRLWCDVLETSGHYRKECARAVINM